jgi:hypothetical protein
METMSILWLTETPRKFITFHGRAKLTQGLRVGASDESGRENTLTIPVPEFCRRERERER